MPERLTPRQHARADNLDRIQHLALRQLADQGAAGLSLRAIARELNIVSSAIYRYYPGRDELITDLVLDAYTDLADHLEAAVSPRYGPRRTWVATCLAMRAWAVAEPHRFALVYGSAVPGYVAPASTIAPAGRVLQCFFDAADQAVAPSAPPISRPLRTQLHAVAAAFASDRDPASVLALTSAFSQVVGFLTLELNGHFVGGFEPADDFFAAVLEGEADRLGL